MSFGSFEFASWAESQGISEAESTIYFCHAFQKKLHIDQVSKISKYEDGSPRFKSITKLIHMIIAELRYDEEAINRLQQKCINYSVNPKNELDYEFLKIYNLRRQGWVLEDENDILEATKTQFVRGLDLIHKPFAPKRFFATGKQVSEQRKFDRDDTGSQYTDVGHKILKAVQKDFSSATAIPPKPREYKGFLIPNKQISLTYVGVPFGGKGRRRWHV